MNRSVLVIGGTRNLGHFTALHFLQAGDRVAVLNRGITADDLPPDVERLRADRTRSEELREALGNRQFDLIVDTALYAGPQADETVRILHGRVGRYVFISTGQVYLVRAGAKPPYREDDYDGDVLPEPEPSSADHPGWIYGAEKRDAEDRLLAGWQEHGFPVTTLRLPMVHSERDYYDRVNNCLARLMDGGPMVVPDDGHPRLRHVWVHDVVSAIGRLAGLSGGIGRAYNISQDETTGLEEFLRLFATRLGRTVRLVRMSRDQLTSRNLLPDCAPFSGRWMSELDNTRGVQELEIRYTPLTMVADALVQNYLSHGAMPPAGYASRAAELALAAGG